MYFSETEADVLKNESILSVEHGKCSEYTLVYTDQTI